MDIQAAPERHSPTRDQLDGRACIDCGAALDGLVDAGHIGRAAVRVKACPACGPRPSLSVEAVWEPLDGDPRTVPVNSEQLNGRACVRCGSTMDGLMPAGQVFTPTNDGRLPWPVRACPRHTGEEMAA